MSVSSNFTPEELNRTVSRIRSMEEIFDTLLAAAARGEKPDPVLLARLLEYYQNGQWLRDYELDELGLLPPDLKRGVLSQDGVFHYLLDECSE